MTWEVIDNFHTGGKVFASDLNYAFGIDLTKKGGTMRHSLATDVSVNLK